MSGMFWEDFDIGMEFKSKPCSIDQEQIQAFATLTGDDNPLHTDPEYAKSTTFGKPIVHGLLGLSMAAGQGEAEGILSGTIVAFAGMEWSFIKPIFVDDTIYQKRTVTEKRTTRKPDRGLMVWEVEIINQKGEIVQQGRRTVLVKRRKQRAV